MKEGYEGDLIQGRKWWIGWYEIGLVFFLSGDTVWLERFIIWFFPCLSLSFFLSLSFLLPSPLPVWMIPSPVFFSVYTVFLSDKNHKVLSILNMRSKEAMEITITWKKHELSVCYCELFTSRQGSRGMPLVPVVPGLLSLIRLTPIQPSFRRRGLFKSKLVTWPLGEL